MRATCPGRVNLIGDHTDYNAGVALPMAVDLTTEVVFAPDDGLAVVLRSEDEEGVAEVDLHAPLDRTYLRGVEPAWARYVSAVVAALRPGHGGRGTVSTRLPIGAGLSSSAALEVAVALALGFEGEPLALAHLCQRAEQAATGVPTGLMDQLVVAGATDRCALLIDFFEITTRAVPVPDDAEIVVVHSGEQRILERTAYAARRAECEAAAYHLGPLGRIGPEAVLGLPDQTLRRRARHVVTECDRVRWFAVALETGDLTEAGRLMVASHGSLARDFEVSTPALDALVARLVRTPGVYGARLTGAGFGGCAVALTAPGAVDLAAFRTPAWRLRPRAGAQVTVLEDGQR